MHRFFTHVIKESATQTATVLAATGVALALDATIESIQARIKKNPPNQNTPHGSEDPSTKFNTPPLAKPPSPKF